MLKETQAILEQAFQILNKVYYNSTLPDVVITIQSSPRAYGHFTIAPVWRTEENSLHEINISAEYLDRPIENIMATLQHECIHLYCSQNGIADTSQGGRYHNKNFKNEAELRGLHIEKGLYIGWSVTTPTNEFIKVLKDNGIIEQFNLSRGIPWSGGGDNGKPTKGIDGKGGADTKGKKKTSTRKYVCPKCANTFRATKDIHVMCLDCFEEFVKQEK